MSDENSRLLKDQAYLVFAGSQLGIFLSLLAILFFHTDSTDASAVVGVFLCVVLFVDAMLVVGERV